MIDRKNFKKWCEFFKETFTKEELAKILALNAMNTRSSIFLDPDRNLSVPDGDYWMCDNELGNYVYEKPLSSTLDVKI